MLIHGLDMNSTYKIISIECWLNQNYALTILERTEKPGNTRESTCFPKKESMSAKTKKLEEI